MKEFGTLAGLRSSEMIRHKDKAETISFLTLRRTFSSYPAECFQHSLKVYFVSSLDHKYLGSRWPKSMGILKMPLTVLGTR